MKTESEVRAALELLRSPGHKQQMEFERPLRSPSFYSVKGVEAALEWVLDALSPKNPIPRTLDMALASKLRHEGDTAAAEKIEQRVIDETVRAIAADEARQSPRTVSRE